MPRKREYKRYHASRMVEEGMKVRFDPLGYMQSFGSTDYKGSKVTGTVVYVNRPHKWFLVEYGNGLRTSYKLYEVGLVVTICG